MLLVMRITSNHWGMGDQLHVAVLIREGRRGGEGCYGNLSPKSPPLQGRCCGCSSAWEPARRVIAEELAAAVARHLQAFTCWSWGPRGRKEDSKTDPFLGSSCRILGKTKLKGLGCFCKLMVLINLPSIWCPAPGLPLHHHSLYSNF